MTLVLINQVWNMSLSFTSCHLRMLCIRVTLFSLLFCIIWGEPRKIPAHMGSRPGGNRRIPAHMGSRPGGNRRIPAHMGSRPGGNRRIPAHMGSRPGGNWKSYFWEVLLPIMNRINVEKKVFNILCPRCHNVFKVGEGVPWKGSHEPSDSFWSI